MNTEPTEPIRRGAGRPRGMSFPKQRTFRITEADNRALEALAAKWRTTISAVWRRAVLETAEREGVE